MYTAAFTHRSRLLLTHVRTLLAFFLLCLNGCITSETAIQNPERLELASSAEEVDPLELGSAVPSVQLENAAGATLDLRSVLLAKPTVLIFYRGGWCPYCNEHLTELAKLEPELLRRGFQIVAVSSDRPEKLHNTAIQISLNYTLLSDSQMMAAQAFGVAFRVPEALVKKYKVEYSIDLEEASGQSHHILPVPSVFLIGPDGRILYRFWNPDYKVRIDPKTLLRATERVSASWNM